MDGHDSQDPKQSTADMTAFNVFFMSILVLIILDDEGGSVQIGVLFLSLILL
ncbi:hypothetical protein Lalb_Chr02g0143211 [Lupinus albus]|uniref:Uncharacterized protein n=1 Tax=Lupinus albus TaxID=3870 RepID=A0A6A4QXF0_LUPAL|nr:hypothetical protein Lalb_Chr02g0143211 [Lupinus albus]